MPADTSAAPMPHAHADLEVIVRRVLMELAVVEPAMLDADDAARVMGGISTRTLHDLPAEKTGKARIGTRTLYHLPTLRKLAAELVGGSIEVTA